MSSVWLNKAGYRVTSRGLEHIVIARKAFGGPLPKGAIVHHLDGTKSNHRGNIAILQDQKTHKIIHQRMDAKKECGNPDWLKCSYCGKYDDPNNMAPSIGGIRRPGYSRGSTMYRHRECHARYERERRVRLKASVNV